MFPIEKDIESKIETITENISKHGLLEEIYPDIIISDFEDDGYNMNGDGILIPNSIVLNTSLFNKKRDFLSKYNNFCGYTDKELLATYYYYVLAHEASHKIRHKQGYNIKDFKEEKIADNNAVELTINRFGDVFKLYLSVLLCNVVDQQEIDKIMKQKNISQSIIDNDTHYKDTELLNFIKSKGCFSLEQEKSIKSLSLNP